MSATAKIAIGALATAAIAWFIYGPLGLGARCASAQTTAAALTSLSATIAAEAPVESAAAAPAASAKTVAGCQAELDARIKDQTVAFASGGTSISSDSLPLLDAIAKALGDCQGASVEVAGHTDRHGSDQLNQALSERRAQAVVAALTERGVPADRLIAKGYGATQPLDRSDTAAADMKNRRIEFHAAVETTP